MTFHTGSLVGAGKDEPWSQILRMKYFILLLIAFSLSACKTRSGNKEDASPSLNAEQTAFLASMFAEIDSLNAVRPDSLYLQIAQLKHCTISPLPVYYLDKKRFLANPTPENLLQSLYQPADVKAFLAAEADGIYTAFFGFKVPRNKRWFYGYSENYFEHHEWMRKPLLEVKGTDFHVIRIEGMVYYTYLRDGQRLYLDNHGFILYPEEFCKEISSMLKHLQEHAAQGDTLII